MDTQFCGPNLSNCLRNSLRICCLNYRFRGFRLFLEPAFIFKNRSVQVGIISEVSLENRYQKQKCSSAYHVRSSVQIGRCSNRKFRSMFSGRHFGRSVQIGKFAPHPEQTEFGSRPWVMWPKIGNLLEIPLQSGLDQVVSALFVSS